MFIQALHLIPLQLAYVTYQYLLYNGIKNNDVNLDLTKLTPVNNTEASKYVVENPCKLAVTKMCHYMFNKYDMECL
jgi:hypothetical protein